MAQFELSTQTLKRLFSAASLELPQDRLILFGLRGCLPAHPTSRSFANNHAVKTVRIDHQHMRCSLGIWDQASDQIAVFAGNTIPSLTGIKKQRRSPKRGVANQLALGFYSQLGDKDYRYVLGIHGFRSRKKHHALRNSAKLPIQRSYDDLDYDLDDDLRQASVYDNMHCAHNEDLNVPRQSSFGCQTIAGSVGVFQINAKDQRRTGPFADFMNALYGSSQTQFAYALFSGKEAQTATNQPNQLGQRLRFGSSGTAVTALQNALKEHGFDPGALDGTAGYQTIEALRKMQQALVKTPDQDLVCGPKTARALGLERSSAPTQPFSWWRLIQDLGLALLFKMLGMAGTKQDYQPKRQKLNSDPKSEAETRLRIAYGQQNYGGQAYDLTKAGVVLKGKTKPELSPGAMVTVPEVFRLYSQQIQSASHKHKVPQALIAMTIATETGAYKRHKFTGPKTFRWEPHVKVKDLDTLDRGDYSAGPMQTLASTARWLIKSMRLKYSASKVGMHFASKPHKTPQDLPLYDPEISIDIGTAMIAKQASKTHLDPVRVAAAYNAGSLRRSTKNRWHLVAHGNHIDRAIGFYGDALAYLKQHFS